MTDDEKKTTIKKPKVVLSDMRLPRDIHWQEYARIITAAGPISAASLSESSVPSTVRQAAIGRDSETGGLVAVADEERCGGLYILGQPRTGKSTLLVSLALNDIEKGYGILFIDPHTDALSDLLARIPQKRLDDVVLLDPTKKDRSFGINLLHCADLTDPIELDNTVGRILDIFTKVWADQQTGRLGIWLEKIIANSAYLLLENPGHTLLDIPPLLWEDTTFRDELLKKVTVKSSVVDFWVNEFDRLTRRDKTEQVGPTQSRLDIFRRNDMVRDIVGQHTSTINLGELLKTQKIVLLSLPVNLSTKVKHLIGTMLLSEVLYAVFERGKLSETERPYFGIYCDEFQEFATPDFARLFTQTGKYKVMPTVAHQTRVGQFGIGDPNAGATLASANKVLFTLSPADARELALEFAKDPQTERYVVSQQPVRDLLDGHHDPQIAKFVNKYLRYLVDKRDDIKADMEGTRIARMIELDTAGFYGAEAQEEGVIGGSHIPSQIGAIKVRQSAILRARMHGIKLGELHEQADRLRVTLRELNRFLTEVMEGKKRTGQEAFSDFLISLAAGYSALPEEYAGVLGLYIKLSYGDNSNTRVIPFDLGTKVTFLSGETARLTHEAARLQAEERHAFEKRYKEEEWDRFYSGRKTARGRREGMKNIIAKAVAIKFKGESPWGFLRYWPKEDNAWGLAQVVAERAGYGGIGCIYYEDFRFGNSYSVEHFAPEVDYTNDCAVDFSPGKSGKEALDALRRSDNVRSYITSANRRKDVSERRKLLQARWSYFSRERPAAARTWEGLDAVGRRWPRMAPRQTPFSATFPAAWQSPPVFPLAAACSLMPVFQ